VCREVCGERQLVFRRCDCLGSGFVGSGLLQCKIARRVKRATALLATFCKVKDGTRSFYEALVRSALERVVDGLDEPLDLATLARAAALSPLHFHRVFRGMIGETPLELQRRLRLERAAEQLGQSSVSITNIAFQAGYETHESFTRAFRQAYACSPSEFRSRASLASSGCARPPAAELGARSGVHFNTRFELERVLTLSTGGEAMHVQIQERPALRVAAVAHLGPYNTISTAFERLGAVAGPAGLLAQPGVAMVGIYHDDPESKPAAELRSEAALVVPESAHIPGELSELRIPAGRYAKTTHVGPYAQLGDTWARLMGEWLPSSGQRVGQGVSYEIYVNDPGSAAPSELRTELYLSLQ
jgi:AraC family transcriptional regulator